MQYHLLHPRQLVLTGVTGSAHRIKMSSLLLFVYFFLLLNTNYIFVQGNQELCFFSFSFSFSFFLSPFSFSFSFLDSQVASGLAAIVIHKGREFCAHRGSWPGSLINCYYLVCRLTGTKNILSGSSPLQSNSSLYSLVLTSYVEGCFNLP